jgi:hypothetical protein
MPQNAAKVRLTPLGVFAIFPSFCSSTKNTCSVLKSSKNAAFLSSFDQK